MNNLPKHHGGGPQRRRAQSSCIGCIGLRPALTTTMGAVWWGTLGTCPSTFSYGRDVVSHVPPLFLGFFFGEVLKKVTSVTF